MSENTTKIETYCRTCDEYTTTNYFNIEEKDQHIEESKSWIREHLNTYPNHEITVESISKTTSHINFKPAESNSERRFPF